MLPASKPSTDKPSRPTIRLEIPLNQSGDGQVIDFMHLAEQKYGFDVVHPEVKAAALDLAGDEDNDDDNDDDEVDLNAGPSESASQSQAQQQQPSKPKNRGKVEGKYDLNDPFIDDTEMLWEEQAASTKDGFFVYSGPLLSESEPTQIEKVDGKGRRGAGSIPTAGGIGKAKATKKKSTVRDTTTIPIKKKQTKKKMEPPTNGANGTNGTNGANEDSRSSTPRKIEPAPVAGGMPTGAAALPTG